MGQGANRTMRRRSIGSLLSAGAIAPNSFALAVPVLDLDVASRPDTVYLPHGGGDYAQQPQWTALDDIRPLFGELTVRPGDVLPEQEIDSLLALSVDSAAVNKPAAVTGKALASARTGARPKLANMNAKIGKAAKFAVLGEFAGGKVNYGKPAPGSLEDFARQCIQLPFASSAGDSRAGYDAAIANPLAEFETGLFRPPVASLELFDDKSIQMLSDERLDGIRPLFGPALADRSGATGLQSAANLAQAAATSAPAAETSVVVPTAADRAEISAPAGPPVSSAPATSEASPAAVAAAPAAAEALPTAQAASAAPAAPPAVAATPESQAAPASAQIVNPFGRDVTLDVQVRNESGANLGILPLSIAKAGDLSVSVSDLLELIGDERTPALETGLRSRATQAGKIGLSDATAAGVSLVYDPRKVALTLTMAADTSRLNTLSVGRGDLDETGNFIEPSGFSAYATIRAALDYIEKGPRTGLQQPLIDGTFAMRAFGFVLESQHSADFNREGSPFNRFGSRLVYDVAKWRTRFALGDNDVLPVSFQQGTPFLGLSVTKLYRNFEPQRNIRPTTLDSFTLNRRSDVEVIVNGMTVRRLSLNPGRYNLTDFPFVSGTNNVRVVAIDPTGQTEVARFSRFFDFNLLKPGLSEFGAFGGIVSEPGLTGPIYLRDEYFASGFYRRGLSNVLTVGANAQFDRTTRQIGAEALLATKLGIFGVNVAGSHFSGEGIGAAARVEFQRINDDAGPGQIRSVRFAAEAYTAKFSSAGQRNFTVYPTAWRLSADATMRLRGNTFVTAEVGYTRARLGFSTFLAGSQLSFTLGDTLNVSLGARYEKGDPRREGFSGFATITKRLGRRSYLSASGETRERRGQLTFSHVGSGNVGSLSANLQLDYLDPSGSLTGTLDYIANRAELGLAHVVNYDGVDNEISDSRTSARAAFSLAMADGGLTLGRPIRDAYAIVGRHSSLRGKTVYVDPRVEGFETKGYDAKTDLFGPALQSELNSYTVRSIEVDVPDAPAGYDLGSGSFLVKPPYRAGYRLIVGSAYSVLLTGILVDETKKPVALAVGKATSLDDPKAPTRQVFTNSQGRFSAAGLSSGRWQIIFEGETRLSYTVTIPEGNEGLVRMGVLEPQQ